MSGSASDSQGNTAAHSNEQAPRSACYEGLAEASKVGAKDRT